MGQTKIGGKTVWYDDELNSKQKKAQKYFDLHYSGNDNDKRKAEEWFDNDGSWVLGDRLREGDYKKAAIQMSRSYDAIPNTVTLDAIRRGGKKQSASKTSNFENNRGKSAAVSAKGNSQG